MKNLSGPGCLGFILQLAPFCVPLIKQYYLSCDLLSRFLYTLDNILPGVNEPDQTLEISFE